MIINVEIMGHNTGWLALGAGVSGGADVILIPEIPYDIELVAESILRRERAGKHFSIIAVAEGAISKESFQKIEILRKRKEKAAEAGDTEKKKQIKAEIKNYETRVVGNTMQLAKELEQLTRVESRITILGHLQRGGIPSANDRLLATRLGTACADFVNKGHYGVMVAARGDGVEAVPLEDIVGKRKKVSLDHPWIASARNVGTCLGDSL